MKKVLLKRSLMIMILFLLIVPFGSIKVQAKAIYTGNKKIDCAVEAIIHRATKGKENLTQKQQLKACYNYIVKNMTYTHSKRRKVKIKPTAAEKKLYKEALATLKADKNIKYSKKFKKDYQHLLSMSGTCKHMSGVMCILANHLGYGANYVTGRFVRNNGSSVEHWWNYIKVDGKMYYCDVQAANFNWKRRHKQKTVDTYYLKPGGNKNWKKHHRTYKHHK